MSGDRIIVSSGKARFRGFHVPLGLNVVIRLTAALLLLGVGILLSVQLGLVRETSSYDGMMLRFFHLRFEPYLFIAAGIAGAMITGIRTRSWTRFIPYMVMGWLTSDMFIVSGWLVATILLPIMLIQTICNLFPYRK